ncbi:zinc-binding dehydrogenase [Paraburkholderia sp. CNPSo 3076]|uniref:zinc-binding dehydrogenase n=1 Tax=Paraburkholderia sp. CNPSo 3076 TaxID=2940936 RepID=UPI002254F57B|nr:zinc-binding dehydrogenase [Paraburkholderia sp. CNPSo 3076]MCX5537938.1 zinc-binding dehydrogenase [Paraburkholderia sp. CNPSo 3076]
MKGIVLTAFGDPAKVLELRTLPDPTPPGPGEVVVRVTRRSIHPGNLAMVRGRFNIPLPADGFVVPGGDGVGVVEAVGEAVGPAQDVKPGARVIFYPSPGAWAERLKTRVELVTPIPDDLSDAIAAQLLPNTVIALMLLRAAKQAVPDAGCETPILLTAAGSSVARILAVAARRRGLKVVSAVRSRNGANALSERFPDLTVVSTADTDWADQVRRAAGGRPLQVVMDPIGGAMVSDLVRLLGDGGALLFYGGLVPEPIALPSVQLAHHEIMFKGVSSSRWLQTTSAEQRREDVAEAIEIGRAAPEQFELEADYDLSRFIEAITHIERADRSGAVLISSDS